MPVRTSAGYPTRDPGQRALKQALNQAKLFYSPQQMIAAAASLRPKSDKWTYSETGLRNFLEDEDGQLLPKNYDALATYWLYTPLGRALRYPDPREAPAFDRVTHALATGQETLPLGLKVDGRFYCYHGSYLHEGHFAIRIIEINSADDHILTVTDTVHDRKSFGKGNKVSTGAMVFADRRPQIVLYGHENKIGFSLMTGTDAVYDDDSELTELLGGFLVLNKDQKLAYRWFLMLRERDNDRAKMIKESGIYTRAELRAPELKRHSDAFDHLAKHQPGETHFIAPIRNYKIDDEQ